MKVFLWRLSRLSSVALLLVLPLSLFGLVSEAKSYRSNVSYNEYVLDASFLPVEEYLRGLREDAPARDGFGRSSDPVIQTAAERLLELRRKADPDLRVFVLDSVPERYMRVANEYYLVSRPLGDTVEVVELSPVAEQRMINRDLIASSLGLPFALAILFLILNWLSLGQVTLWAKKPE